MGSSTEEISISLPMMDEVKKRGKTLYKWEEIHKEKSTAAQREAMRGTEAQAGGH